MKKLILVLAYMLTMGATIAQEKGKFGMEINNGMSLFTNYSALSLFQDETAVSTCNLAEINLFYATKNNFTWTLSLFGNRGNTSNIALNETYGIHGLVLGFRRSAMVSEKSELYFGMGVGMAVVNNDFDGYSVNRLGLKTNWGLGYNYYVTSNTYIGASINYSTIGCFSVMGGLSIPDMPLGADMTNYSLNQKTDVQGLNFQIGLGIKF